MHRLFAVRKLGVVVYAVKLTNLTYCSSKYIQFTLEIGVQSARLQSLIKSMIRAFMECLFHVLV